MIGPMPFKDPEKKRAYGREQARKRYAQDPVGRAAYMRQWRATRTLEQIEAAARTQKEWVAANPDKVAATHARRPDRREYHRQQKKQLREESPERVRNQKLKNSYGITLEQYNDLLAKQNGQCAICGRPDHDAKSKNLAVDHCHITRKVRGLLCGNCNNGLGRFQDDIALLERALAYLKAS